MLFNQPSQIQLTIFQQKSFENALVFSFKLFINRYFTLNKLITKMTLSITLHWDILSNNTLLMFPTLSFKTTFTLKFSKVSYILRSFHQSSFLIWNEQDEIFHLFFKVINFAHRHEVHSCWQLIKVLRWGSSKFNLLDHVWELMFHGRCLCCLKFRNVIDFLKFELKEIPSLDIFESNEHWIQVTQVRNQGCQDLKLNQRRYE